MSTEITPANNAGQEKNANTTPETITSFPISKVREAFLAKQAEVISLNSHSKAQQNAMTSEVDSSNPARKHSYVFTGRDLMNMPLDTTPCLWEPFLRKYEVVTLTGSSDVGKSSLLRDFAIAVALKETSFLGHPLNVKHGRAIYFTTEESQVSVSSALKKQAERVGTNDLSGLCYIFNEEKPYDVILEQLLEAPTDVVIIDCFADVFDGRLNDNTSVRNYLQEISELSSASECLFILLHHNGKRTEFGAPDKNNLIGSQGFEAKTRLVMDLRKEPDGSRSLWFTKGNNIPDSMKKEALRLSFDENQHFELIGKSQYVPATVNNKFHIDKPKIMLAVSEIEKEHGGKISQDKILLELMKRKGFNIPSKGTLNGWLKERRLKESQDTDQVVAA